MPGPGRRRPAVAHVTDRARPARRRGRTAAPCRRARGSSSSAASDGQIATDSVFIAESTGVGNYAPFVEGPRLPAPRSDAAVVVYSGSIYVIGGRDASGAPTDTVFSLTTADGRWRAAHRVDAGRRPEAAWAARRRGRDVDG